MLVDFIDTLIISANGKISLSWFQFQTKNSDDNDVADVIMKVFNLILMKSKHKTNFFSASWHECVNE